eukprot:gnl/TRDRNA2_/TRDRNA2_39374_c0_seq1.p1 gnl/TRDRNA2_/TRDRNA2_39374_c0~~gnl/TRDRNA2_/TRDRNA2_39374_c0_seq1.p1  ORF type:complete len:704 (-),score=154.61 gnl/TRDRNA2_/TRDRNA2_39374_c0_seq1:71-2182(-)
MSRTAIKSLVCASACATAALAASHVKKFKLGQDTNYPPYAYKDDATGDMKGIGYDVAMSMSAMCDDIEIEVVQVKWAECWTPNGLGKALDTGAVDACMTYTHTKGIRNEFADFSYGILAVNKAAGLLTLLDENGVPKIAGFDDLTGKKVVDVAGWAPTADGLDFVENKCTASNYKKDGYILLQADGAENNNQLALEMLLDGRADAVFMYADQAYNYKKSCEKGEASTWNCEQWTQFGKKFAYVQTGQFGYVNNGTTLALAKKGSGVAEALNPCLAKYMATKDYYDMCVKHGQVAVCYPNEFFPTAEGDGKAKPYNMRADEHPGPYPETCSSGYCTCPPDKFTFAQDTNYPPYAYKDDATGEMLGIGNDIALGMNKLCPHLHIDIVETKWENCWTPDGLGQLLEDGTLDACMTYTHTRGLRPQFCDFSWGILAVNKAAGLMVRLKDDGTPEIHGYDDLSGKKVVDVAGWAPTADGLNFVENKCTDKGYADDYILLQADGTDNNNQLALEMLLDGTADAVFIYADQAINYKEQCENPTGTITWNCDQWTQLGKKFAYVQTGQFSYVHNGTTLALTKKGSGVAEKVNPCLKKFMLTKEYYFICEKYKFMDTCYPNDYFPGGALDASGELGKDREGAGGKDMKGKGTPDYNVPADELTGDCLNGYCPCGDAPTEAPPKKEGEETDAAVSEAKISVSLLALGILLWRP